jgi:acyl-CoA thioesterase FadM
MHTETVMVYFDDLDAMGVVHNAKYVTLFERALAAYWAQRSRYLRLVFANEPVERLTDLRARFDTALR